MENNTFIDEKISLEKWMHISFNMCYVLEDKFFSNKELRELFDLTDFNSRSLVNFLITKDMVYKSKTAKPRLNNIVVKLEEIEHDLWFDDNFHYCKNKYFTYRTNKLYWDSIMSNDTV